MTRPRGGGDATGGDATGGERPGGLVVVATPIGNLEDLSPRARRALREADVIACEDTRRTARLLAGAGVRSGLTRLISCHAHNEREQSAVLVERMKGGETVAFVTDAGTPTVSDPGSRLVEAAIAAGVCVTAVPGPSALLLALALSGFDASRFCFDGFLPRKGPARRARIAAVASQAQTSVIFEAPGRLAATLAELSVACGGDRRVVIAREMTKVHEEVWRGALRDATPWAAGREILGECTVVVEGRATTPPDVSDDQIEAALAACGSRDTSTRDAAAAVAKELGVARRRVYETAVRRHPRGAAPR